MRITGLWTQAHSERQGFALALQLLRPRGTLVLKSTFHGATEFDAAPIVIDEITIVGSRCGRFGPALDLLKKGAIVRCPTLDFGHWIAEPFFMGRWDTLKGTGRSNGF